MTESTYLNTIIAHSNYHVIGKSVPNLCQIHVTKKGMHIIQHKPHGYHILFIISIISAGVTTNGFSGKCFKFPVTKYASTFFRASITIS